MHWGRKKKKGDPGRGRVRRGPFPRSLLAPYNLATVACGYENLVCKPPPGSCPRGAACGTSLAPVSKLEAMAARLWGARNPPARCRLWAVPGLPRGSTRDPVCTVKINGTALGSRPLGTAHCSLDTARHIL